MKNFLLVLIIVFTLSFHSAHADHPEGTVKVDIYGLVCDFCARALEKVFAKQDAVDNIEVSLDSKIVTIHIKHGYDLDDAIIEKKIIDAGYNIEEIRRGG